MSAAGAFIDYYLSKEELDSLFRGNDGEKRNWGLY